MTAQQVAVIGAGWAGLAAAVTATQAGHHVTLFEAARHWGGRARSLEPDSANSTSAATASAARNPLKQQLDNGQHILIGAYTDTLALLRTVGIRPNSVLHRIPLTLLYPDGNGLRLAHWPAPLNLLVGILSARGWTLADKTALLNTTRSWQRAGFHCPDSLTVATLCHNLSDTIRQQLMEPLCLSALNTPPERASAQVFLRVLQDALMAGRGSSNLLLPRTDLSQLLPTPAALWLEQHGAQLRPGQRVHTLERAGTWQVNGAAFDTVILATPASAACQLLKELQNKTRSQSAAPDAAMQHWTAAAAALQYEAIATVYLHAPEARLPRPLLALHSSPEHPAQYVFDRGQLGGPPGLLALVVSASQGSSETLQRQVLEQARQQLSALLDTRLLRPVKTIVEKRATFACTPALPRPGLHIAPGLLACGDYIAGPYPATLEGAVRSGLAAARAIGAGHF